MIIRLGAQFFLNILMHRASNGGVGNSNLRDRNIGTFLAMSFENLLRISRKRTKAVVGSHSRLATQSRSRGDI